MGSIGRQTFHGIDQANRTRSEAAKEQHAVSNPRAGECLVVRQSVEQPERRDKGNQAKAALSKTNPGAVARGDKLAKERPDLPHFVANGTDHSHGEHIGGVAVQVDRQRGCPGVKSGSLPFQTVTQW